MSKTRKPITRFGFHNMLSNLIRVYEQARATGDCNEQVLGLANVAGRSCIVLQRTIADPSDASISPVTTIFIDRASLLPVLVEGHDLDGEMEFSYEFDEIELNVGLTDADFTPKANDIADPK